MMVDPLQFFDEEYSAVQTSITDVSALVLECRDAVSSSLSIQKSLQEMYDSGQLTLSNLSPFLLKISQILDISSSLLDAIDNIKNHIILESKEK